MKFHLFLLPIILFLSLSLKSRSNVENRLTWNNCPVSDSTKKSSLSVISDSLKFRETMSLIINKESLNHNIENIHYGEMCQNIYEIIYDTNSTIDKNQKVNMLISLVCFQEHYLGAYWSTVISNPNDFDLTSGRAFSIVFSPFIGCPEPLRDYDMNLFNTNEFSGENKVFFEQIDSLLKSNSSTDEIKMKYQGMVLKHLLLGSFYRQYEEFFGK